MRRTWKNALRMPTGDFEKAIAGGFGSEWLSGPWGNGSQWLTLQKDSPCILPHLSLLFER
jgi:hypothetical protein